MAFYLESLCFESVGGFAITRDANNHPIEKQWRRVKPTNGDPYRYETRDEAERIARVIGARVVEAP